MKPILFNSEMVRAILAGRKTVTRRLVKLKYDNTHHEMFTNKYGTRLIEIQNEVEGETFGKNPDGSTWHKLRGYIEPKPKYKKGEILYVRETWQEVFETEYMDFDSGREIKNIHDLITNFNEIDKIECEMSSGWAPTGIDKRMKYIVYKADNLQYSDEKYELRWHPSIHMPKEAARIFLQVTDIITERIQDITSEQAKAEGIDLSSGTPFPKATARDCHGASNDLSMYQAKFVLLWDSIYSLPQPVKEKGVITHYISYPWEDIYETREYNGLPWLVHGNPWVYAYEFKQIDKEKVYEQIKN